MCMVTTVVIFIPDIEYFITYIHQDICLSLFMILYPVDLSSEAIDLTPA